MGLQHCSGYSAGAAGVVAACLVGHLDRAGRQGSRGRPKEEAHFAENHPDQEGTNPQEDSPCRNHRVLEEEDRLDPSPEAGLVAGREGTRWDFVGNQERLEDLGGWGRRERVLDEIGPG